MDQIREINNATRRLIRNKQVMKYTFQFDEFEEAYARILYDLEHTDAELYLVMSKNELWHLVDICVIKKYNRALGKLCRGNSGDLKGYDGNCYTQMPANNYLV